MLLVVDDWVLPWLLSLDVSEVALLPLLVDDADDMLLLVDDSDELPLDVSWLDALLDELDDDRQLQQTSIVVPAGPGGTDGRTGSPLGVQLIDRISQNSPSEI